MKRRTKKKQALNLMRRWYKIVQRVRGKHDLCTTMARLAMREPGPIVVPQ